MTKSMLFVRLAGQNLVKNRQYTFPFFLTGAGCAALCYLMCFLAYNPGVQDTYAAPYVELTLRLGGVVTGFLAVWIMAYANGFMIRRRSRELALYNILGLQKSNVAAVLWLEMLALCAGCIAAGVAVGALFSKLALLALLRLMRFEVPLGFYISARGAGETAAAMAALFFCLYFYDLYRVWKSDPIELLHAGQVGEREPKTRRLTALVGLAALAGGYGLALTSRGVNNAIVNFFLAVLLVILATHCLFGAGSVAALKLLRRNKRFYYQPRHFTAVSGLIYRMNQNARGLANICILVTAVLVTVATTVCLYAGIETSLATFYPNDIGMYGYCDAESYRTADFSDWDARLRAVAAGYGVAEDEFASFPLLIVDTHYADGAFAVDMGAGDTDPTAMNVRMMPAADYTRLTGEAVTLAPGQVLANGLPEGLRTFTLGGVPLEAAGSCTAFPQVEGQVGYRNIICLVVADQNTLADLAETITPTGDGFVPDIRWCAAINPSRLSDEEIQQCAAALQAAAEPLPAGLKQAFFFTNSTTRTELYGLYGSFLYLGLFVAIIFTLATVLIIYYKQISEGYEDRNRFLILQQVGMSAAEVRATIRTQVLLVFFLPLGMAAIHLAAAFPLLFQLLSAFGVTNQAQFTLCCGVTLAAFAVCYVAVYLLTARQYYRIVKM